MGRGFWTGVRIFLLDLAPHRSYFVLSMNTMTDITEQDASPLDEGLEQSQARLGILGRANGAGLVLLEAVEALAVKAGRLVKDRADEDGLDLAVVSAVKDLSMAYSKLVRSVRQNVLLEEKLEAIFRDRVSGVEDARRARALKRAEAEAAKATADEEVDYQREHGAAIAREEAVTDVIEQLIYARYSDESDRMETLQEDYAELLEEGAGYEDYGDRPITETVTRLCKALDLEPDWDCFAWEDWAKAEARDGVAGSPYVSVERGGSGECVISLRGLQGVGLAPRETGPP
jgi:hypothetical protein